MKNQNQPIEELQAPQEQNKDWPLGKNIVKVVGGVTLVILSVMQVSAFVRDTTLENLEKSFISSQNSFSKNVDAANKAFESVKSSFESRCDAYRALKAYKELKKIALQDVTFNPCTEQFPFTLPAPTEQTKPADQTATPELPPQAQPVVTNN